MAQSQVVRTALCALGASACFASMAACIRGLSPNVGGITGVFARSAVGLLVAVLLHIAFRRPFRIRNKKVMLIRVLSGTAALTSFFLALRRIDLATATLLIYTCPLWVSLLGRLILKERLSWRSLLGLPLGLAGIIFILGIGPEGEALLLDLDFRSETRLGLLLGLTASLASAIAYICLRVLGKTDDALSIVTCFSTTALLISLPFALEQLGEAWPGPGDLALLGGAGLFGGAGQICLTLAYRYGRAAQVSVMTLIQVPIAVLLSIVLFAVVPTPWTLLGGSLVFIGAALQISRGEADEETGG